MNEKNRNLVVRVITSFVLLPVVLWLVARGGYWCAGLIAVAAAICAGEYYGIVSGGRLGVIPWVAVAVTALLPLYTVWVAGRFALWAFWTLEALFLFGWIAHLLQGDVAQAPVRAAHLMSGAFYAGVGFTALAALRPLDHGVSWLVSALVITWGNDTCAYFAGRLFGRHRLYPAVSPNKTWEGFVGGFAGSIGVMFIARAGFFPNLAPRDCVILGLGGGLLGPAGDLCESMLKRAYQVKDSSHLVPGHGGLLDRVDALIFNAPWVFIYVTFLRRWIGP